MTVKTIEAEIAIAKYINPRVNLVVPNVSWGAGIHECDMLVITKSRYAWEIEIKVSKADLLKDKQKRHGHLSDRIRDFYFAIPKSLLACYPDIPGRCGILVIDENMRVKKVRDPIHNSNAIKWSDAEYANIARLGAMRIWGLKSKIVAFKNANTKVGNG